MGLIGAKLPMRSRDWRDLAHLGQPVAVRFGIGKSSCQGCLVGAPRSQYGRIQCQHCYPSPSVRPALPRAVPAPFSQTVDLPVLAERRAWIGKNLAPRAVLRDAFPYRGQSRNLLSCVKHLGYSQPRPSLACLAASQTILNVDLLAQPQVRLRRMRSALIRSSVRPRAALLAQHATTTPTFVTDPIRPSGRQDTFSRRSGRWARAAVLHEKDCRKCSKRS